MDNYQGQHGYGADRVDVYGNPVGAGQYGGGATAPGGGHGAMGMGGHAGAGAGGQFQPAREDHKTGGILHRSGSSSSSSVRSLSSIHKSN
jgi:hypothetical protein